MARVKPTLTTSQVVARTKDGTLWPVKHHTAPKACSSWSLSLASALMLCSYLGESVEIGPQDQHGDHHHQGHTQA